MYIYDHHFVKYFIFMWRIAFGLLLFIVLYPMLNTLLLTYCVQHLPTVVQIILCLVCREVNVSNVSNL